MRIAAWEIVLTGVMGLVGWLVWPHVAPASPLAALVAWRLVAWGAHGLARAKLDARNAPERF